MSMSSRRWSFCRAWRSRFRVIAIRSSPIPELSRRFSIFMIKSRADSETFEALCRELLNEGSSVRLEARGASMSPCIRDGEIVYITPVIVSKLRKDDIVLTRSNNSFRVHRLVFIDCQNDRFVTRGDCGQQDDPAVRGEEILGIAIAKEVRIGRKVVCAKFKGLGGQLLRAAARTQHLLMKILPTDRAEQPRSSARARTLLGVLSLFAVLFAASYSQAQVTVDATTSTAGLSPAGTFTGTFTHTTGTGTNRLLIVSVAFDITQSPGTLVDGITYNGTALTLWGTHNDAGNTRRVEMWYLLNPASGTNLTVAVTLTGPTAGATVGAVAGATTFTGVDQTVPFGAFNFADGAGGGNSQLDIPSVINGMVFDTLATGGDQTVTVPGPQVTQWNLNSGGNTASPDVQSSGSSRSGAPSVPISESFSGTSNWSLGAVSINPTSADLSVTTSVPSAVFLGVQNPTYTITVKNNGPSAANNVIVNDTWAATGLTLGTVTTTSGTCTGTAPIKCTLATPMASGATVTITVPVTASAAGSYANTAVVSDSNTPPDPNTGNNSYTAVATVQSATCATVSQAAAGINGGGLLHTYYPGTASAAAGAKSISVGTATGAGAAIATGNLLLVIQMQDASINDTNGVAYGNGYTGQGFTALNSAGDYEFVTATGPVAAGKVPISGAG